MTYYLVSIVNLENTADHTPNVVLELNPRCRKAEKQKRTFSCLFQGSVDNNNSELINSSKKDALRFKIWNNRRAISREPINIKTNQCSLRCSGKQTWDDLPLHICKSNKSIHNWNVCCFCDVINEAGISKQRRIVGAKDIVEHFVAENNSKSIALNNHNCTQKKSRFSCEPRGNRILERQNTIR